MMRYIFNFLNQEDLQSNAESNENYLEFKLDFLGEKISEALNTVAISIDTEGASTQNYKIFIFSVDDAIRNGLQSYLIKNQLIHETSEISPKASYTLVVESDTPSFRPFISKTLFPEYNLLAQFYTNAGLTEDIQEDWKLRDPTPDEKQAYLQAIYQYFFTTQVIPADDKTMPNVEAQRFIKEFLKDRRHFLRTARWSYVDEDNTKSVTTLFRFFATFYPSTIPTVNEYLASHPQALRRHGEQKMPLTICKDFGAAGTTTVVVDLNPLVLTGEAGKVNQKAEFNALEAKSQLLVSSVPRNEDLGKCISDKLNVKAKKPLQVTSFEKELYLRALFTYFHPYYDKEQHENQQQEALAFVKWLTKGDSNCLLANKRNWLGDDTPNTFATHSLLTALRFFETAYPNTRGYIVDFRDSLGQDFKADSEKLSQRRYIVKHDSRNETISYTQTVIANPIGILKPTYITHSHSMKLAVAKKMGNLPYVVTSDKKTEQYVAVDKEGNKIQRRIFDILDESFKRGLSPSQKQEYVNRLKHYFDPAHHPVGYDLREDAKSFVNKLISEPDHFMRKSRYKLLFKAQDGYTRGYMELLICFMHKFGFVEPDNTLSDLGGIINQEIRNIAASANSDSFLSYAYTTFSYSYLPNEYADIQLQAVELLTKDQTNIDIGQASCTFEFTRRRFSSSF